MVIRPICLNETYCIEYKDNDPKTYLRGLCNGYLCFKASGNNWFYIYSNKIYPNPSFFTYISFNNLFLKKIHTLRITKNTRYNPEINCFYVGYTNGQIEKLCGINYLLFREKCCFSNLLFIYCVGDSYNKKTLSFVGNSPF